MRCDKCRSLNTGHKGKLNSLSKKKEKDGACGLLCHQFQLKTYKRFWTDFLDNSLHHHHRKNQLSRSESLWPKPLYRQCWIYFTLSPICMFSLSCPPLCSTLSAHFKTVSIRLCPNCSTNLFYFLILLFVCSVHRVVVSLIYHSKYER